METKQRTRLLDVPSVLVFTIIWSSLSRGVAAYSSKADVSYKDSWCGRSLYESGSAYEQVLDKLLDELSVLIAGDPEELWVNSEFGLVATASCSVQDWSKCATCLSFLSSNLKTWCPYAKIARVTLNDCEIEYAFETKTYYLDEEESIFFNTDRIGDIVHELDLFL